MRFVYTVYQKFGWVKKKKRLRDIFEELCFIFLRPIKPVSIPFEIINIVQKIRFKMKNGTLRNQQQVFFFLQHRHTSKLTTAKENKSDPALFSEHTHSPAVS